MTKTYLFNHIINTMTMKKHNSLIIAVLLGFAFGCVPARDATNTPESTDFYFRPAPAAENHQHVLLHDRGTGETFCTGCNYSTKTPKK